MTAVIIILTLVIGLYILSLRGRSGHPGLPELRKWNYAHRGLHGSDVPENSMAAFRAALDAGYGIELDLHLMADGNLAVIHDSNLLRVAGADVRIEDLTLSDLDRYRLLGSEERIPLFREVLDLFAGKAPLIVELKSANGNYESICEAAASMLDLYRGPYCIESFDPFCVRWFRKNRLDVIRGQLSADFLKGKSKLPWVARFAATYLLTNFFTVPDFLAYQFRDRHTISNQICRKLYGIQGVSWTITSQEDLDRAAEEGWISIFEGFKP